MRKLSNEYMVFIAKETEEKMKTKEEEKKTRILGVYYVSIRVAGCPQNERYIFFFCRFYAYKMFFCSLQSSTTMIFQKWVKIFKRNTK